ncbi:Hypothetical_protein [Hexamita inflata]|uniref:Hypothetical_protein n=1 Tax=Hexamita inflata TaxID=28002 RepID=A0AA86NJL5_9EUKA|nr:Hypothetical protein HINF_LOCUS8120 [Hexamita inflata]
MDLTQNDLTQSHISGITDPLIQTSPIKLNKSNVLPICKRSIAYQIQLADDMLEFLTQNPSQKLPKSMMTDLVEIVNAYGKTINYQLGDPDSQSLNQQFVEPHLSSDISQNELRCLKAIAESNSDSETSKLLFEDKVAEVFKAQHHQLITKPIQEHNSTSNSSNHPYQLQINNKRTYNHVTQVQDHKSKELQGFCEIMRGKTPVEPCTWTEGVQTIVRCEK